MRSVRIGAGQGFYGDTVTAAVDMAGLGGVHYIAFDALAELTLAILQKDRQRDPGLGFTRDLPVAMRLLLPLCREKGIRLITNAGGLNPISAGAEVAKVARGLGLRGLRVATVTGDDLLDRIDSLRAGGVDLSNAETGAAVESVADRLVFACAYLGAGPIVEALRQGADVVVTGRVADSALFLAPAIFELGWKWDDWDRLASGTVMGHLLECSGQATGGNFGGDWRAVPEPWRLGYPLAEVHENGEFVISKPPGTGGLVTFDTVREQLLYEVHDPARYIAPDVIADFTTVRLQDLGGDRVLVQGASGRMRPERLKGVLGYHEGWVGEGRIGYCWPDALAKARLAEEILRHRFHIAGVRYEEIRVEYQGINSLHGPLSPDPEGELNEVYLRVAVRTRTQEDAARATREFPYLGLNGPPGIGGYGGITPPRELLGIWPVSIPRGLVEPSIRVAVEEVG